ncbi:MAG: hypothetical protein QOF19_159 [Alphaproteobacteria bacterium]|nr:hypothetical protein [Alphaproteobacteria bacterium]
MPINRFARGLQHTALTVACALGLAGCEPEIAPAERYPGPWQDPDPFVAETMAKKSDRLFQLCKSAYMRPAFNKPGGRNEYLVYCTFDRSEWWAFAVYTGMNEIIGPNNIYQDIPPPN